MFYTNVTLKYSLLDYYTGADG